MLNTAVVAVEETELDIVEVGDVVTDGKSPSPSHSSAASSIGGSTIINPPDSTTLLRSSVAAWKAIVGLFGNATICMCTFGLALRFLVLTTSTIVHIILV